MLACYMCHDPALVDGRTVFLTFVFGLVAFLLSPFCRLINRKWQDTVALVVPLAILAYWFFFQFHLASLDQLHIDFYRSMWGQNAWKLNSGICYAFGAAFSLQILRTPPLWRRIYGGVGLLVFLGLLTSIEFIKPVVRTV
jgi:hypothetical protein